MSFQEIGKIANGLIQSVLFISVLIRLKKSEKKLQHFVFWFGLLIHLFNFISSIFYQSWIFIVYIFCIAYSIYIYTNNPTTPK
jgi:hypothetical protein